ncbi:MAG: hypothetical protein AB7T06_07395 [Kofleriaceae bacterium]
MFITLIALIANFERVADFLERMEKRGSRRLGMFSTTLGVLSLVAAVIIQLVTDERALARGLAGLGMFVTVLGLSWLVSRCTRKPKPRPPRKRTRRRSTPRASIAGGSRKSLPAGRASEPTAIRRTSTTRSRTTRR